MSENLPCALIDKIRRAIDDLQTYGLLRGEDKKFYDGYVDCLTWVRHRLYPEEDLEAEGDV